MSKHLSSIKIAGVDHGLHCREKVLAETGARRRVVLAAGDTRIGLAQGDEILTIRGHYVANAFDVERALWDSHAGDRVRLQVMCEGKALSMNLVLSAHRGRKVGVGAGLRDRRDARAGNSSVFVADPQP